MYSLQVDSCLMILYHSCLLGTGIEIQHKYVLFLLPVSVDGLRNDEVQLVTFPGLRQCFDFPVVLVRVGMVTQRAYSCKKTASVISKGSLLGTLYILQ